MKTPKLPLAIACALGLAACGSSPSYDHGYYDNSNSHRGPSYASNAGTYAEFGRVVAIETMGSNRDGRTTGAGAVLGGVVGGVLGHQVGSGRGNDAATVVGAIGGAVVGNNIERNRANGDVDYRIDVRLENGSIRSVIQEEVNDIRVGDRVRIENGRAYRG